MLPGKVCGDVIQWEGEMWKSEERKTEMTAPITLAPLDEQTLVVLRSQDTAVRVLKRFFAGGLDAVPRRTASGRVRTVTAAWEAELIRVIELDPHEVGQDTANWTTEKLGSVLRPAHRCDLGQHTGVLVTEETVRVYLHAYEYGGLASDLDFAAQGRR